MMKCKCGCNQEVKPGNRFVNGHNGRCRSEESNEKIRQAMLGNKNGAGYIPSKEWRKKRSKDMLGNQRAKGFKHSEEHKRRMSELMKGNQNGKGFKFTKEMKRKSTLSHIKTGEDFLRNHQLRFRRKTCFFGCDGVPELHHEPNLDERNAKDWEGRMTTLCRSCHNKIRSNLISVPNSGWIYWTKEETKNLFEELEKQND